MVDLRVVPVFFVALALAINTFILPRVNHFGIGLTVKQLNDESCQAVQGLVACEDQWIHRQSGLSYLPCSSLAARSKWLPAVDLLDGPAVTTLPGDTIQLYDTNTGSVKAVEISNRPSHLASLHLHAIDAWIHPEDPEKLTFFLNNHATPADPADAHSVGADSTVEIFEGRLGSTSWTHVKTVRHPLVKTPNNLVATGPRSFYVSNDHREKTHTLKRQASLAGLAYGASAIVHCQASGAQPDCIDAATGLIYPNGITRGPSDIIYVGSSATGEITALHQQADFTLLEGETVASLGTTIDNIHVTEEGEIIAATIPKVLHFVDRCRDGGKTSSAVRVYSIRNETTQDKFYGKKYNTTVIFSDGKAELTSGTTNAQLYKGKLYLTGVTTSTLVVCVSPAFEAAGY